jgi:hypothetical protein
MPSRAVVTTIQGGHDKYRANFVVRLSEERALDIPTCSTPSARTPSHFAGTRSSGQAALADEFSHSSPHLGPI